MSPDNRGPFSTSQSLPDPSICSHAYRNAVAGLILGALCIPLAILSEIVPWPYLIPAVDFKYTRYLLVVPAVLGIVVLVLGHRSRSQIKRNPGGRKGSKIAVVGLILGYSGIAISAFLGFGSTSPQRDLYPTYEDAAVESLRVLLTAEITYYETFRVGYSQNISALGPPVGGSLPGPEAAGLIDEISASGSRNGYRFTYTPGKKETNGRVETFVLRADPVKIGLNCRTHYFTDQTAQIRYDKEKPATQESPPITY